MVKNTGKVAFGTMRSAFFFSLIISLAIAMVVIFGPFFYPLFWAAVIAVTFYPMYRWLLRYLKYPALTSFVSVLLVVLILVIPIVVLGVILVNESVSLYNTAINSGVFSNPQEVISRFDGTFLEPVAQSLSEQWINLADNVAKLSGIVLSAVLSSYQQIRESFFLIMKFFFMFFLMLYSLYYFLKDGAGILKKLMRLSPLGDQYESLLYQRFTSTTKATLKGTLILGGIQGTMGGILFWITGVQGAFVWGFIMVLLGIIPAVGPALIIGIAGIAMLASGAIWQAITLLIGAGVVSIVDNLLRGPLVGKDTQMHPLVVLLTTLGGLIVFGLSGFVIGPVLAALFISVMSIYKHYYRNELMNN